MIRRKASLVSLLVLVTLSLSLPSTSAQDCSQVPLITLRALNGTANSPSSVGVNVTGLLNSPLTSQTFISTYLSDGSQAASDALSYRVSTFIGAGLNCTGFGANVTLLQTNGSALEQTLRLNATQFAFFTNQALLATASVNITQDIVDATLAPYLNSFIYGSAFPICNTSDCPAVPTTAAPTTPAPTSPPPVANATLTGPVFHISGATPNVSWTFENNGTTYSNPTLLLSTNTLYQISLDFTNSRHPFGFSLIGPGSSNIGQLVNLGVGPNCGTTAFPNTYITTNITTPCLLNFTITAPIHFFYRCAIPTHLGMVGSIVVASGDLDASNVLGVFVNATTTAPPTTSAPTNATAPPTNATATTATPTTAAPTTTAPTTTAPTTPAPTTATPTTPVPTTAVPTFAPQYCTSVSVPYNVTVAKSDPIYTNVQHSNTTQQFVYLNVTTLVNGTNITTPVQQFYYINTTYVRNVTTPGCINQTTQVPRVANVTLVNQTSADGTTWQWVNVTTYVTINVTNPDNTTSILNVTDPVTTCVPANITTPQTFVNSTAYPQLQNITTYYYVSERTGFNNYTTVEPQLNTTTTCYNQTCHLEYYQANYTIFNWSSTITPGQVPANVTTLNPVFTNITTYQPVPVTVYQIQNITQSFLTFQSNLVYDYGYVNYTYINQTLNGTFVTQENRTVVLSNTSYVVSIPYSWTMQPTGNYTNVTQTVNQTIYQTVTDLKPVTTLTPVLTLQPVNVTTFNITTRNISTTSTTLVIVPVTTLTNVTYNDNVTTTVNIPYTITNYTLDNTTFLETVAYNVTFFNVTYNTTSVNISVLSNTSYFQIYNVSTYVSLNITNGTAIFENVSSIVNNTHTYYLINTTTITQVQPVTKVLNITTFQTTNVTVPSWTLVNDTQPITTTIQQYVTTYNYTTTTQNVSSQIPIGWQWQTITTQQPVLTNVTLYQNITQYNVTTAVQLQNITHNIYINNTVSGTNYTIIGSHYEFAPVIVNRTVAQLIAINNYTIYQPISKPVVVNYTSTTSVQNVSAQIQTWNAIPWVRYYNASTPVCVVQYPTPPPNVTITICEVYAQNQTTAVATIGQRYELVNQSFPYTANVTTYQLQNTTTNTTQSSWVNVTTTVNTTVPMAKWHYVNGTLTNTTVQQIPNQFELRTIATVAIGSGNITREVNRTTTSLVPSFTQVPVYATQNVTIQVNRTFQVPVIQNVSSLVNITGPVNQTCIPTPGSIIATNITTLQNVSIISNQSQIVTVNRTLWTYVTELQNITTITGYTYTMQNITTPGFQNVTQNITVPDTTVTVTVSVPPVVHTYNVTYPNGTVVEVNVTSDPSYNITVLVPSFNTTQNVSIPANITNLVNVSKPIATWSLQNVTLLRPNGTIAVNITQNTTVTTWGFQNKTTFTCTVQGVIGNTTQYQLVTSYTTDSELINVTTPTLVSVGTVEVPTFQNVTTGPTLVNETVFRPNINIVTYTVENVTIGWNNVTVSNNYTGLVNQTYFENTTVSTSNTTLVNQTKYVIGWTWQNVTIITPTVFPNYTMVLELRNYTYYVDTITGWVNATRCKNITGPPGSYQYPTYPSDSTFCYRATNTNSGKAQFDSLKYLLLWSWQGINITSFPNIRFPGWLNSESISPYFKGQFIYDPPYDSPFVPVGQSSNIDFTGPLFVNELASLMEHFVQYFGQLWGCQGQKGDRFPGYLGNSRMDVIHAGMRIDYTLYKRFYNQIVQALRYRGMNPPDIDTYLVPMFENGPFLRGGSLQICTDPATCPCAPGTFPCSGQCLARCPVLPTDPICIKLVKTISTQQGFFSTNTTASFAALTTAVRTAFVGSNGQVQNGVAVIGLLNASSPTSAIYYAGDAPLANPSSGELDEVVTHYAQFLARDLGCGVNPLDGPLQNYTGAAIGPAHASLAINYTTFQSWFAIVTNALVYYGVPRADIDAIVPSYSATFLRGSPSAICTTPDCPCATGLIANNGTCATPAPPTSAPTKGLPTGIPTLPPATSAPNTTTAPTTTAPPTSTPTPSGNTTTAPPTTPGPTTTPAPTALPGAASTLQLGPVIMACIAMLLTWLL